MSKLPKNPTLGDLLDAYPLDVGPDEPWPWWRNAIYGVGLRVESAGSWIMEAACPPEPVIPPETWLKLYEGVKRPAQRGDDDEVS
jgi:hypothetical protein